MSIVSSFVSLINIHIPIISLKGLYINVKRKKSNAIGQEASIASKLKSKMIAALYSLGDFEVTG